MSIVSCQGLPKFLLSLSIDALIPHNQVNYTGTNMILVVRL